MIIVSQDEKGIINFDKMSTLYIKQRDNMHGIFYIGIEIQGALGWYKTEERAKEILDEIVKSTNSKFIVLTNRIMGEDEKRFRAKHNKKTIIEYDNLVLDYATDIKYIPGKNIFRMPKE